MRYRGEPEVHAPFATCELAHVELKNSNRII
jgi:hypothetical protein